MNILITGITGFIGGKVCTALLKEQHNITTLIRPHTKLERYQKFASKGITCIFGDITSKKFIDDVFKNHSFDCVYHIAAIRGGRPFPKSDYFSTNVHSTEYIGIQCLKHNIRMVFCSSVGVFGAIPHELPPTEKTKRKNDNYYHFTKIEAEKRLQKLVSQGLKLIIIRPSITYGTGDYGFPYTLIKLVDKGIMICPTRDIRINMVDATTLVAAFLYAGTRDVTWGSAFNIADSTPVSLKELVEFISQKLHHLPYSAWKQCPTWIFRFVEWLFTHIFRNELWKARIELISRNWYYDASPAIEELGIPTHETLPDFSTIIQWYKDGGKK